MAINFSPIRPLWTLPCCRTTACSKESSVKTTVWCFLFQIPVPTLLLQNISLRLPSHLSVPSIFRSMTCFRRQFLRKMWPIQFAFLGFIVCRILLQLCTPVNTPFFRRSVQLIFSILLQHDNSKLSRDFLCILRSDQVLALYKIVFQMQHFTSFFLNFNLLFLYKVEIRSFAIS